MRGTLALILFFIVTPAHAHDVFGLNAGPFWLGALHVLVAPLCIVAIIALAAAIPFSSGETIIGSSITAGAVAFVTALWAPAALAAAGPIGIVVAGLSAALGFQPNLAFGIFLGAMAGFGAGAAAQLDLRVVSASLGVAVAIVSLLLWSVEAFVYTQRFLPLARRVVGAWTAAIALLLGALAVRILFTPHR